MLKFIRTLFVTFPSSGAKYILLETGEPDAAPIYFKSNCFNPRTVALPTIT